jgi:hypothetical protein
MECYLSSEQIRYIIQNAGKIKDDCKCIVCNGTGWVSWDENGEDVKAGKTSSLDRDYGECEECFGIGYIF